MDAQVNDLYVHHSLKVDDDHVHYYTKGSGRPIEMPQRLRLPGYCMQGIVDPPQDYQSIPTRLPAYSRC